VTEKALIFAPRYYEQDPEFEDVLYGTDLRDGMIVMLQDTFMRGDPARGTTDPFERQKLMSVNRWCTVTALRVHPRAGLGPLVSFMGVYADGMKFPRTYDASYTWIVKRVPPADA
jgi:hypothetical protein